MRQWGFSNRILVIWGWGRVGKGGWRGVGEGLGRGWGRKGVGKRLGEGQGGTHTGKAWSQVSQVSSGPTRATSAVHSPPTYTTLQEPPARRVHLPVGKMKVVGKLCQVPLRDRGKMRLPFIHGRWSVNGQELYKEALEEIQGFNVEPSHVRTVNKWDKCVAFREPSLPSRAVARSLGSCTALKVCMDSVLRAGSGRNGDIKRPQGTVRGCRRDVGPVKSIVASAHQLLNVSMPVGSPEESEPSVPDNVVPALAWPKRTGVDMDAVLT